MSNAMTKAETIVKKFFSSDEENPTVTLTPRETLAVIKVAKRVFVNVIIDRDEDCREADCTIFEVTKKEAIYTIKEVSLKENRTVKVTLEKRAPLIISLGTWY